MGRLCIAVTGVWQKHPATEPKPPTKGGDEGDDYADEGFEKDGGTLRGGQRQGDEEGYEYEEYEEEPEDYYPDEEAVRKVREKLRTVNDIKQAAQAVVVRRFSAVNEQLEEDGYYDDDDR